MALTKVKFTPGINREGTQYTTGYGWYDCDKVRFRKGRPECIGGWAKYSEESFKGVCRSLSDWGTRVGDRYLGIGTNLKFYIESGGEYFDVTPIRLATTGVASFSATNGSSTIEVTDAGNGVSAGDFVTFSGAVSLGGDITADVLNQEYQVSATIDANTYEIEAVDTAGNPVVANASDTGNGGGSVDAAYQIGVGTNFFVPSTGWGAGPYGSGPYGSSSPLTATNQLRLWSQDAFGDDLIFNPRAGGVYYWDESAGLGQRGIALGDLPGASDAPVVALQTLVSEVDRHVICFGANPIGSTTIDPLLVRWSDQENAADWTPRATNSAGGQVLPTGTQIIGAVRTRQEILIFTDGGIVSMRFTGAPFVFSFSVVSEGVTLASPKAFAVSGDAVYFMDKDAFYVYRGAVQRLPSLVHDYVYERLNREQIYKVFGAFNPDYSEVSFFYPSGAGSTEIDSYVSFNFIESAWAIGTFERGAYLMPNTQQYPIMSSADLTNINEQYLYAHEFGASADGAPLSAFIETGDMEIADGESFFFISRMIPDVEFSGNMNDAHLTVTFNGRNFPLEDTQNLYTAVIEPDTQQNFVRVRSRELVMRFEASGTSFCWRIGDLRLDYRTDGKR